jgi:hypothetical protein
MGSEMAFHDFKRKFAYFGVAVGHGSKHVHMEKMIKGECVPYTVVVHKNKVDAVYVSKARRRFGLRPEDGVSDEEFNRA